MFKAILFFSIALLAGWFLRELFTVSPHISNTDEFNTESVSSVEYSQVQNVIPHHVLTEKSLEQNIVTVSKKEVDDRLKKLLDSNCFYDALSLYLDANAEEKEKKGYKAVMEKYLSDLTQKDPAEALEQMQIFVDNEPENSLFQLMVKTYITQGAYAQAIALIIDKKENYSSEENDKYLEIQLKITAQSYIEVLNKRKAYDELSHFLEEMINYDSADSFYSFTLAKLFMKLDKKQEASLLLEELQYDETYVQKVKTFMKVIDKEESQNEYQFSIPLQKYGDHFSVKVFLDNTAFNLMLDTGATFIFIDEEKASMLEVVRNGLILKTAGNEISAKLCQASQMNIGNLQLSNIKVTIAPFKRQGIDGLLGMNFFKQFKFFIDQDAGMLYLDPK